MELTLEKEKLYSTQTEKNMQFGLYIHIYLYIQKDKILIVCNVMQIYPDNVS